MNVDHTYWDHCDACISVGIVAYRSGAMLWLEGQVLKIANSGIGGMLQSPHNRMNAIVADLFCCNGTPNSHQSNG